MNQEKKYTVLHAHTDASLLDGLSKPQQLADRYKEIGSDGGAVTNHGNISDIIKFIQMMNELKLKPVVGIELYVCEQHASIRDKDNRKLNHLVILCKNTSGYKQLLKIVHEANKPEHYYYKPRLSLDQLSAFLDGNIIGFSGHLGSHMADIVLEKGVDEGVKAAMYFKDIFHGQFWLECQLMDKIHNPEQIRATDLIRQVSAKTKIPVIATPDAHYARRQDCELQRILLCSNMKTTLRKALEPDFMLRGFFISDNFHVPTYQEMIDYGHTVEELENTNQILELIEKYEILSPPSLPKFDCPGEMNDHEYLTQLCRQGWKKFVVGKIDKDKWQEYTERVKYELDIIKEAGLSSYFLIVQDIVKEVHRLGYLTGTSRGSAGGCLVSFLIEITKLDPIPYELQFSRFYNKARVGSLPDIDLDVEAGCREQIIEYIKNKYGSDRVGQLLTFQNIKGSRALKEVFRAYGDVSFEEINQMTKHIIEEHKITDDLQAMKDAGEESSIIKWCLQNRADKFKDWCVLNEDGSLSGPYAKRFDQAMHLEKIKASQSKHAAGVVIGSKPLDEIGPLVLDTKNDKLIFGFTMEDAEAVGLVKMDVLGLHFLDKMHLVSKLNPEFKTDINDYDLKDEATWDLLKSGRTKSCFQLESQLGQSFSKKLMPEHIEHLAGLTSILRPGCIAEDVDIIIGQNIRPNGNNGFTKVKIKNLYERFHRNHHLYEKTIISYDTNNHCLIENKIKNIWHNGNKEVYSLKFRKVKREKIYNGTRQYNLQCTLDHQLFVWNKGWLQLQDIQIGDRFLVMSGAENCKRREITKYFKHEKIFRSICFRNYDYKCILCDWSEASLDVNHLDGNRKTNNHPDNLCFLCPNHHRMYSENKISKEEIISARQSLSLPRNELLIWAQYLGCDFIDNKEVYDIEVETPHHNFIAGDVVVHNCLEAYKEDGKSVTEHYIKRKNGEEEVTYIHPALEPILKSSYGELIYQEGAAKIATDIAGFTPEEAQLLIKAIGKKKADIMAKMKKQFQEGVERTKIVPTEIGEEIFSWIEASQRYGFNHSHAVGYSLNTYLSAYAKAHYPLEFYTANLYYARDRLKPQQEIYQLVNDAKSFNIFVQPPNILKCNSRFALMDGQIYFGLSDIKYVGESVVDEIITDFNHVTKWFDFLSVFSERINSRAVESLINAGACDCYNIPRTKMLFEYNLWSQLSKREQSWSITQKYTDLKIAFVAMLASPTGKNGGCYNKKSVEKVKGLLELLENPPYELVDKPHQIAQMENSLLGVCITATFLDESKAKYKANCSCQEFNEGFNNQNSYISIAAQVDNLRTTTTKKGADPGREMAFVTASDDSGIANNIVVFPDFWDEFKGILCEGNRVLISGQRSKNGSLSIQSVEQL